MQLPYSHGLELSLAAATSPLALSLSLSLRPDKALRTTYTIGGNLEGLFCWRCCGHCGRVGALGRPCELHCSRNDFVWICITLLITPLPV